MEIVDYCRNMENELTAWKAKLFDAANRIDQLPPPSRKMVQPRLGELRIIVALLEDKIGMLKARRPRDWKRFKDDIEEKINALRENYSALMD